MEMCGDCSFGYLEATVNFYKKDDVSLEFLRAHGVLPFKVTCPVCENECVRNGSVWRCTNSYKVEKTKKRKWCGFKVSDRKGTFIGGARVDPWKMIIFLNHFLSKYFDYELLVKELGLSNSTVADWRSFASEVCIAAVEEEAAIGGEGVIVEIDESHFGHAKYDRGRQLSNIWVFGGIERGSKKCFAVPLTGEFSEAGSTSRDKATLIPLIKRYIKKGSVIISDCWKAYDGIPLVEGMDYTHRKINHSENYVDPQDNSIHTQNIERLWRSMKEDWARPGIRAQYFVQYIGRFMFRRKDNPRQRLHRFLLAAGHLYKHGSEASAPHEEGEDETEDENDVTY